MKRFRNWVPALGIVALIVLFLKLPEAPNLFGFFKCKTCASNDPYLQLLGAGYFSLLVAIALLFPAFPNRHIARGGIIWSILLALTLTYLNLPSLCPACLIAHVCHILIWTLWTFSPSLEKSRAYKYVKERLCLVLFAPISMIALFSCLNLTFMAYGLKVNHPVSASSLKHGDVLPQFIAETIGGRSIASADTTKTEGTIINFISPDCPYCKEQLPIVNTVATQLKKGAFRIINISPALPSELVAHSPDTEWVEDKGSELRKLFKVSGFPTMFVIGNEGKITQVIAGVPDHLETHLLKSLSKKH